MNNSYSKTTINYSNISDYCDNAIVMVSWFEFSICFAHFFLLRTAESVSVIIFAICTVIANVALFVFITFSKPNKTIFDKIFRAHSVVDCVVGFVIMPFYCIYTIFNYWPLGKMICHIYVSFDYTTCHIGILHMVYIAYARVRSLLAPKTYESEAFMKNSRNVLLGLWLFSSILWLPAINLIIHFTYEERSCYFTFTLAYIIVQDIIAYIIPILSLLSLTLFIMYIYRLKESARNQKTKQTQTAKRHANFTNLSFIFSNSRQLQSRELRMKERSKDKRFNLYIKLTIILLTFIALWLPWIIAWPIKSGCNECVNDTAYIVFYWLGYIQSLVNPILLLILNPNYQKHKKKI
jgi:5-hydroxytryptamine receptor 5